MRRRSECSSSRRRASRWPDWIRRGSRCSQADGPTPARHRRRGQGMPRPTRVRCRRLTSTRAPTSRVGIWAQVGRTGPGSRRRMRDMPGHNRRLRNDTLRATTASANSSNAPSRRIRRTRRVRARAPATNRRSINTCTSSRLESRLIARAPRLLLCSSSSSSMATGMSHP